MVATSNAQVIFNEIPTGYPEPGKTTKTVSGDFDLDTPLDGGVLIKTLVLSIDPYMRGRMRDAKIESYVPAFPLGKPLVNYGVGTVLRSEHSSFQNGQHVYGQLEFAEYAVVKDPSQLKVLPEDSGLQWSTFVGAAGMPGQTAYTAWKEYAHPKPGQVAFVSGGAGPVGSFVIQLAKQDGLRVIASAGSDAKIEFMKSVGADVAFNYKTTSTQDVLAKEGPIDIYWDNVGGETLDTALANASLGARFIECGMISGYNNSQGNGIKNIQKVLEKRIHMTGIMVFDLLSKYEKEFYETVPKALAEGKIKYAEHVYHGLDSANRAILDVQTGKNDAKAVILVADR